MRETSQAIDEAAALWAARTDGAHLTPDEQKELDTWLAGDSRRLGAYAKARAVVVQVRRARALGPDALADRAPPQVHHPGRRAFLTWGASAAAVAGVSVTAWSVLSSKGQRFTTRRGEVRLIPLGDGSSVTLNTASRISVVFEAARYVVTLLEGEALFSVASDRGAGRAQAGSRPFVIEAGDAVITALSSQFLVSRLGAEPVRVLVRNGEVAVRRRYHLADPSLHMGANSRIDLGAGALTARSVAADEVARELIWREGMLSFEDVPLDRAVAQFARYSDIHIVLDDPALKAETVTGLFSANDPEGFARAVAGTLDLRLRRDGTAVRLSR